MGGYRAPLRVDLAGGWTDLAPYTHDHGGEVVNFTIDKWVTATPDDDGNIDFKFDVPAGSGLGTSGALNVAKIAALSVDEVSDLDTIAELAFEKNKETVVAVKTNGHRHMVDSIDFYS